MRSIPQDILDALIAVSDEAMVSDRVEEHFCPIIPISDYGKLIRR